jgi:molybdopterin converting factor subunit 1
MHIKVRLFATLRQLAGWPQQSLDLLEGATVAEALAELDRRYPQLTVTKRTIYVAVNQEYGRNEQVLHDGDELALFPPVSGGSSAWQVWHRGGPVTKPRCRRGG